jgi:hypothetical protein
MITLRSKTFAFLAATVAFLAATDRYVSSAPMQPLGYPNYGSFVPVACQRGGPNCLPVDNNAPTKCGGSGHPCVIDSGPDCQNASNCGTDTTGNHNLNGASNMPGVVGRQTPQGGKPTAPAKPASGGAVKAH